MCIKFVFSSGFHYHLNRVQVRRGKRHCSISTDSISQLSFESSNYFFGISADVFLHSQFGPSFIGQGLRVFTGPLRFAYQEQAWKARKSSQMIYTWMIIFLTMTFCVHSSYCAWRTELTFVSMSTCRITCFIRKQIV
jgi:hypothetical protein